MGLEGEEGLSVRRFVAAKHGTLAAVLGGEGGRVGVQVGGLTERQSQQGLHRSRLYREM